MAGWLDDLADERNAMEAARGQRALQASQFVSKVSRSIDEIFQEAWRYIHNLRSNTRPLESEVVLGEQLVAYWNIPGCFSLRITGEYTTGVIFTPDGSDYSTCWTFTDYSPDKLKSRIKEEVKRI